MAVGERLISTGHHKISGLSAHERYVVTGYNKDTLTLTKSDGQPPLLPRAISKARPFAWLRLTHKSYRVSFAHSDFRQSVFLSKELFHDVSEKSPCIDVFTDQPDKAKDSLDKSDTTFSAIERVMHTKTTNDRYLTEQPKTLHSDITEALKHLTQAHNQPLHDKAVNFALNHLSEKEAAFTQKNWSSPRFAMPLKKLSSPSSKKRLKRLAKRADTLSVEYSDGTLDHSSGAGHGKAYPSEHWSR